MATKTTPYTPELIAELRTLTASCPTWLEARGVLEKRLGVHPDNITRANRRHGLWGAKENPAVAAFGRPLRRLFLDIETSPNVVLTWRIGHKISLSHDNLLKERAIICVGWKWEGEKEVHSVQWDEKQNDKTLLSQLIDIVNEADEIVMHNGDRFDFPWLRTRCLFHGLPIINPQSKTVDTLQWARRNFYFNSNRLDYIARFLGLGGKIKTEYGLWKEIVLNRDERSMNLMTTYCKRDVALLEQVWKRLKQLVNPKTHAGVLEGKPLWSCPRTGSVNVKVSKTRVTAAGVRQYQFQNRDDGTYYTVSEKVHQQYVDARS